jgi:ketosteroid isomerase-like protein
VGDRRIEDARVTEGCVAFQNSEITSLTRWLQPKQGVVVIARESSVVNRPEDVQGVFEVAKGWVDAWQNRDIERYISYYSKEFDSQGKDVDQYEAYKRSVFKSYKTMVVKMLDMRVVTHAKYSIVMMNQFFSGDNRFKSDGRKMIYLKKEQDGSWKIVRELFDNFLLQHKIQF